MLSKLIAWAKSDNGRQRLHDLGAAIALILGVWKSLSEAGVL
jgi:hypothetical protein